VNYVILATDALPTYAVWAPVAARLWRKHGYRVLLFIERTSAWSEPFGQAVLNGLWASAMMSPLPRTGAQTIANTMRCSRLVAAALSWLEPEDFLLTADVDMMPLQRAFFDRTEPFVVLRAMFNVWLSSQVVPPVIDLTGILPGAFRFPMCYSVPTDTPILMADYTWCRADKIAAGDRLLAFEEERAPHRRHMQESVVEAVAPRLKETVTIETATGPIICSPEHPWLVRFAPQGRKRGQHGRLGVGYVRGPHWREAEKIEPGMQVYRFCSPAEAIEENEDYMAGYVRGLTEGDGTIERASTAKAVIAITDPEALDRLCVYLGRLGIFYDRRYLGIPRKSRTGFQGRKPQELVRFGGRTCRESSRRVLDWPLTTRAAAAGYLGGMFDSEGSLNGWDLRIYQNDGATMDRVLACGKLLNIDLRRQECRTRRCKVVRLYTRSLANDLVRFFSITRPAISRKRNIVGRSLSNGWVTVTAIRNTGPVPMVDLQTSSKTFIAGGYASHNCGATVEIWRELFPEIVVGDPVGSLARLVGDTPDQVDLDETLLSRRFLDSPRAAGPVKVVDEAGVWQKGELTLVDPLNLPLLSEYFNMPRGMLRLDDLWYPALGTPKPEAALDYIPFRFSPGSKPFRCFDVVAAYFPEERAWLDAYRETLDPRLP
jgi:hypothetical protein